MTVIVRSDVKWTDAAPDPWAVVPSGGNVAESMREQSMLPTGWQSGFVRSPRQGMLLVTCVTVAIGGVGRPSTAVASPVSPVVLTALSTHPQGTRSEPPGAEASEAITAREQIDRIQDVFGLTVTDLARILAVSRPTVYAWLQEEVVVPRDAVVAERLRELYGMAAEWDERVGVSVNRYLKAPVVGEASLLELLQRDPWDSEAMRQALAVLEQKISQRMEAHALDRARTDASADTAQRQRERLRDALRRAQPYRR